jgi:hypothetical protein
MMTDVKFQPVIELSFRFWQASLKTKDGFFTGGGRARQIKNYYFPAFVYKNAKT